MQIQRDGIARGGKGIHLAHIRQKYCALPAREPRLCRADLDIEPAVLQVQKVIVPPPVGAQDCVVVFDDAL